MTNPVPMQVGGPAVVVASGVRGLAFTGMRGARFLVEAGVGMILLGVALVRRGRSRVIQPGHSLR